MAPFIQNISYHSPAGATHKYRADFYILNYTFTASLRSQFYTQLTDKNRWLTGERRRFGGMRLGSILSQVTLLCIFLCMFCCVLFCCVVCCVVRSVYSVGGAWPLRGDGPRLPPYSEKCYFLIFFYYPLPIFLYPFYPQKY